MKSKKTMGVIGLFISIIVAAFVFQGLVTENGSRQSKDNDEMLLAQREQGVRHKANRLRSALRMMSTVEVCWRPSKSVGN